MIIDSSVVTSALMESSDRSDWARRVLRASKLRAPHLMPVEVCQVLRRRVMGGVISQKYAGLALRGLNELQTELHPFEPFATRVWELRDSVSAYDAWYVALAESLDAPLATLDLRLAQAPGPRCHFVVPQGS